MAAARTISRAVGTAPNSILGEAGADRLGGGNGADFLDGGDGTDTLTGGLGADRLTGGTGGDRFVFDDGHAGVGAAARDLVIDFGGAGGDRLDLTAIDANLASAADQMFAWRGTAAFTAVGQVRFTTTLLPGSVVV